MLQNHLRQVSKVNSYIKNKRNVEKVVSVLSICFWTLNFVFAELSINMFMKIISAKTSTWLDDAAKKEMTNDPFFISRTEMIMDSLGFVLAVIITFSSVTIILIRKMQLKNMLNQMGMYIVLGYNRRRVFDICMIEPIADMAIAFPVSLVISIVVWNRLSKLEMISSMLKLMDNSVSLDIANYIMCAGVMFLVTAIHTRLFIDRSMKKGIRYMLGKGVV